MLSKVLVASTLLLIALAVGFVSFSDSVSSPLFDERRPAYAPEIADPSDALTFARSATSLLLVTSQNDRSVTGLDLTAALGRDRTSDLLALYRDLEFEGLLAIESPSVDVPLDDLVRPIDDVGPHLAAGTNFKAHAEEVYLDDPPFLFPKLVESTAWNASVPFTARLDYEAELCMIPIDDITEPDADTRLALILCNDFTDRWTLFREVDLSGPLGRSGFPSGKGCDGCLPTGYLVVIPRDAEFYRALEIELYVNDALRQRFQMEQMILSIEEIVAQAFGEGDAPYQYGAATVKLLPRGHIPAGSLILTGTAAGIAFKPVNIWNQGFYLQPGDVIRTEARFLGHLENVVGAE